MFIFLENILIEIFRSLQLTVKWFNNMYTQTKEMKQMWQMLITGEFI